MSTGPTMMTPELYEYYRLHAFRDLPVLKALRERTSELDFSIMQISPEQGQFINFLVKLMGARKTIEVGVFTGYSTLCTAMALPEDGKIIACDKSHDWTKIAKEYWHQAGVEQKIDLRLAPAGETLDHLLNDNLAGTFDFAFIDADKVNYLEYYEQTLRLLRAGGMMAMDNVFMDGGVADLGNDEPGVKVMRLLNERIQQDDRVEMCIVPISDGVTLIQKK